MSRNVMSRAPRHTTRRATFNAPPRGRLPRPEDVIPTFRRHLLEGPCELCYEIRWTWLADGLCTPCRGHQPPCHTHAGAGETHGERDCRDCTRMPR